MTQVSPPLRKVHSEEPSDPFQIHHCKLKNFTSTCPSGRVNTNSTCPNDHTCTSIPFNGHYIYRPQTKLRESNVFYTCLSVILLVSHSVHRGEVYPYMQWGCTPPGHRPPPPRRSLKRVVRILLECILVTNISTCPSG